MKLSKYGFLPFLLLTDYTTITFLKVNTSSNHTRLILSIMLIRMMPSTELSIYLCVLGISWFVFGIFVDLSINSGHFSVAIGQHSITSWGPKNYLINIWILWGHVVSFSRNDGIKFSGSLILSYITLSKNSFIIELRWQPESLIIQFLSDLMVNCVQSGPCIIYSTILSKEKILVILEFFIGKELVIHSLELRGLRIDGVIGYSSSFCVDCNIDEVLLLPIIT